MTFSAQLLWFTFSQHLLIHLQEPITANMRKAHKILKIAMQILHSICK